MAEGKNRHSPAKSGRKKQIVLVVDPDEHTLSSSRTLLKKFGYHFFKATTGAKAISTASMVTPSLVIVAQELPDMTGFELIRQFRKSRGLAHIPFICLTGQDDSDLKNFHLGHDAAGYLCHPIEPDVLYRTVQAAIEKNPRSSMRVRAVVPVKVYGLQHDALYGAYSLALSTGGMFLRTMSPVSVNSEISLEFDLNGRSIAAESVVLYNCQGGGETCEESGIGLRFIDIAARDRDCIREFIRTEVMKEGPPLSRKC